MQIVILKVKILISIVNSIQNIWFCAIQSSLRRGGLKNTYYTNKWLMDGWVGTRTPCIYEYRNKILQYNTSIILLRLFY